MSMLSAETCLAPLFLSLGTLDKNVICWAQDDYINHNLSLIMKKKSMELLKKH